MPRTHYDNLQVARNASSGVIKNAYKALVQQWHPDKHPKHETGCYQLQHHELGQLQTKKLWEFYMQPLGKFKTCIVHRVVENIAHVAPINLLTGLCS